MLGPIRRTPLSKLGILVGLGPIASASLLISTLVVGTLGGSHTVARARGPYGYLDGYKPDDESTEFETEATGWHDVRITAYDGSGSIQFCAY